jgi:hypothetical protein
LYYQFLLWDASADAALLTVDDGKQRLQLLVLKIKNERKKIKQKTQFKKMWLFIQI